MAELIDKSELCKQIISMRKKEDGFYKHNSALTECELLVGVFPSVTEADIRAKAIDEFAERLIAKLELSAEGAKDSKDLSKYSAYKQAIEIVQEVAKEYGKDTNVRSDGWIPVEQKLPKEDERVLCFHSHGFSDCGVLIGKTWCCDMDEYAIKRDNVIAWMPIAPYQKGE